MRALTTNDVDAVTNGDQITRFSHAQNTTTVVVTGNPPINSHPGFLPTPPTGGGGGGGGSGGAGGGVSSAAINFAVAHTHNHMGSVGQAETMKIEHALEVIYDAAKANPNTIVTGPSGTSETLGSLANDLQNTSFEITNQGSFPVRQDGSIAGAYTVNSTGSSVVTVNASSSDVQNAALYARGAGDNYVIFHEIGHGADYFNGLGNGGPNQETDADTWNQGIAAALHLPTLSTAGGTIIG